eukprot:5820975-Amphidinium_carterae.1
MKLRSWLEKMVDLLKSLGSWTNLERCGLQTGFGVASKSDEELQSIVDFENNMMASLWRLSFCMIRSRTSSMIRNTSAGFPQCLAGLLHVELVKVQESLQLFKQMNEAYKEACTIALPAVQILVARCALSSPVYKLFMMLLEAGSFEVITPQAQEALHAIFKGLGQTKIVEDSLKDLREKETRYSNNKSLQHFFEWHSTVSSCLLEQYRR